MLTIAHHAQRIANRSKDAAQFDDDMNQPKSQFPLKGIASVHLTIHASHRDILRGKAAVRSRDAQNCHSPLPKMLFVRLANLRADREPAGPIFIRPVGRRKLPVDTPQ